MSAAVCAAIALFAIVWIRLVWSTSIKAPETLVTIGLLAIIAAWLTRWFSLPVMVRPVHRPPVEGLRVAAVTTFVASHEPIDMLEQTLVAMHDMAYAHDTWVLDEEDSAQVRALCARLGVLHFTRLGQPAYQAADGPYALRTKYGNYNAWCNEIGHGRYDVLAAFDPDQVPEPQYLQRTLGFLSVERVAFVQTPQVYYNQGASFVARGAAEESYGYYSTHLMASYALGHTIVIGSHGVHRLLALRAVGGFPAHDAEDLYLTMEYRAADWCGVYVPEILAMGMTPVDWPGYLKQQVRWARSLLDIKLRVLPRMRERMSFMHRVLNLFHGALYLRALVIPLVFAGIAMLLLTGTVPAFLSPAPIAAVGALLVTFKLFERFQQRYYLDPQRERGVSWRAAALQLAKWPAFARALADAIAGRRVAYALTAKISSERREWSVAPTQVVAAALIAVSWYIGTVRHGDLNTALDLLALLSIAMPLALAATDALPTAKAFNAELHRERCRAMAMSGADAGQ